MDNSFVQFVGDKHNLQIGGVKLLGITAENGRKLLFTVLFLLLLYLIGLLLRFIAGRFGGTPQRTAF